MVGRRTSQLSITSRSVSIALALLLVACASNEQVPDETVDEEQTETTLAENEGTPADSSGAEAIELLVWFSNEDQVPTDAFETFHEKYPTIRVTPDFLGSENIFENLQRAGTDPDLAPDVISIDGPQLPLLIDLGHVMPITELVAQFEEEEPELYNDLFPSVWGDATIDGEKYGMGGSGVVSSLYYRSDWFEESGLDHPPSSWDEVLEAARTIVAADPERVGFGMMYDPADNPIHWATNLPAHMGVTDNADGLGNLQYDTDQGHYYINFHQTLMREGLTHRESIAWGFDELRGSFAGGETAMYIDSDGTATEGLADLLVWDEQWKMAPLPVSLTGDSQDGQLTMTADPYVIHPLTEHPYEASLVLRYLADNALDLTLKHQTWRSRSVQESEEFAERLPWLEDTSVIRETAQRPVYPPNLEEHNLVSVAMIHEAILNPDEDAATIAANYQPQFDVIESPTN